MFGIAVGVMALTVIDDLLKNAAGELGQHASYTFAAHIKSPPGELPGLRLGGKTERGGFTVIDVTLGDKAYIVVLKGDKVAIKTPDGWKAAAELRASKERFDPTAVLARRFQSFKNPAEEAAHLALVVKLKEQGDGAYSGTLSEDGAKEFISKDAWASFGNKPPVFDAKGTAKWWIKDRALVKYEYSIQGKMELQTGAFQVVEDIDNTTVVEIMHVGSTKVEVPDEAKKLLKP